MIETPKKLFWNRSASRKVSRVTLASITGLLLVIAAVGCSTTREIARKDFSTEIISREQAVATLRKNLRLGVIKLPRGGSYQISEVSTSGINCAGSRRVILSSERWMGPFVDGRTIIKETYRDVDLPDVALTFEEVAGIKVMNAAGKLNGNFECFIALFNNTGTSIGEIYNARRGTLYPRFQLEEVLQTLLVVCPNVK